jgi:gliding motility-associated-like protein
MKKLAILAIVTFISITSFAQITTVNQIGATCDAAYVICDKNGLVVTDVQNGSNASLANSPSCFGKPRKQSVYVKFTVRKTGTLEFIISPLDSALADVAGQTASEYDYGLYDFTGCSGIDMNLADQICCNFNSNFRTVGTYRTGITSFGNATCGLGAGASLDPFSAPITVTEGNEYVILIDRDILDNPDGPGNSANGGFLLTFQGSFEIEPFPDMSFNGSNAAGQIFCCSPEFISVLNLSDYLAPTVTHTWDFANGNTSSLESPDSTEFATAGDYLVGYTYEGQDGCTYTASSQFSLLPPSAMLIPTAFSPNGDNINDDWRITVEGLDTYRISVYNRWGERVFDASSNDAEAIVVGASGAITWDGNVQGTSTPIEQGVYVFAAVGEGLDGNKYNLKDALTILR